MKNLKFIVLFFLLLSCSSSIIAQYKYDELMPSAVLKEDFYIFKNTIQRIHPNINLYTSQLKLDSIADKIEGELDNSMTPIRFFTKLSRYTHSIRNAHTSLRPPEAYLDFINSSAKGLPISFLYRNDSLIVVKYFSPDKRMASGDVIHKINNIPVKTIMDSLSRLTFVDGYNKSYSDYISSTFLSRRFSYFFGLPEYFEIEFSNNERSIDKVRIKALPRNSFYQQISTVVKETNYEFQIIDNTARIIVRDFSIDRVAKFDRFLKKSFRKIRKNKIQSLIVDLRGNRGGYPEATNALLRFFISEPVYPIKEQFTIVDELVDNTNIIKDDAFNYFHIQEKFKTDDYFIIKDAVKIKTEPDKTPYLGNLIFLVDENCASATTSFLGQIKTHRKDAIIIGRKTLGNPVIVVANYMVSLQLPNSNITARIPLVSSEKNVDFKNPKGGVTPDIMIPLTISDIQNKTDASLEKALQTINLMTKE